MNNFICSVIWEKVGDTISLTTQYQVVYVFWREIFFKNCINILLLLSHGVSINFLLWISFFFFHFPQVFLLINFIIVQLRLINFIIHHYSSTSSTIKLISLSLETWIFWQLPSCFGVCSFFLSFSGFCKFWLPCTLIIDKRHW